MPPRPGQHHVRQQRRRRVRGQRGEANGAGVASAGCAGAAVFRGNRVVDNTYGVRCYGFSPAGGSGGGSGGGGWRVPCGLWGRGWAVGGRGGGVVRPQHGCRVGGGERACRAPGAGTLRGEHRGGSACGRARACAGAGTSCVMWCAATRLRACGSRRAATRSWRAAWCRGVRWACREVVFKGNGVQMEVRAGGCPAVRRCALCRSGGAGLTIAAGGGGAYVGCDFSGNTGAGIELLAGAGATLLRCTLRRNGRSGLLLRGGGGGEGVRAGGERGVWRRRRGARVRRGADTSTGGGATTEFLCNVHASGAAAATACGAGCRAARRRCLRRRRRRLRRRLLRRPVVRALRLRRGHACARGRRTRRLSHVRLPRGGGGAGCGGRASAGAAGRALRVRAADAARRRRHVGCRPALRGVCVRGLRARGARARRRCRSVPRQRRVGRTRRRRRVAGGSAPVFGAGNVFDRQEKAAVAVAGDGAGGLFERCRVTRAAGCGVSVDRGGAPSLTGLEVSLCRVGVHLRQGGGAVLKGCLVYDNAQHGVLADEGVVEASVVGCRLYTRHDAGAFEDRSGGAGDGSGGGAGAGGGRVAVRETKIRRLFSPTLLQGEEGVWWWWWWRQHQHQRRWGYRRAGGRPWRRRSVPWRGGSVRVAPW